MLFKLELLFPELPNTRMIKFTLPEDGEILMRMSEMPNNKIADIFLNDLAESNPRLAAGFDFVERKIGKSFARRKLEETFSPALVGAKVGSERYTEVMDRERARLRAGEKNVRLINAVITKLLHDEEDMEPEGHGPLRNFIGDVMERIREILPPKNTPN